MTRLSFKSERVFRWLRQFHICSVEDLLRATLNTHLKLALKSSKYFEMSRTRQQSVSIHTTVSLFHSLQRSNSLINLCVSQQWFRCTRPSSGLISPEVNHWALSWASYIYFNILTICFSKRDPNIIYFPKVNTSNFKHLRLENV
jgi:hypothetical protein